MKVRIFLDEAVVYGSQFTVNGFNKRREFKGKKACNLLHKLS
jgi:hypothetical protein